jgi:hypothetical protein
MPMGQSVMVKCRAHNKMGKKIKDKKTKYYTENWILAR